jgi:hypothetical protein
MKRISNLLYYSVQGTIYVNSIQSKDIFSKLSGKSMRMGCAVLLSILVVCCGRQPAKTGSTITTTAITPIPLITASPAATLDSKAVLRENIVQVLGTDDRKIPRLTKISYSVPETGDITITWAINDNAFQNSTKADAQIDATNILKVLENSNTRFIYVILIGNVSMQDKYGNVAKIRAMSLGFNKSKLDKINWEDFQPSDIYNLADVADIADEWQ